MLSLTLSQLNLVVKVQLLMRFQARENRQSRKPEPNQADLRQRGLELEKKSPVPQLLQPEQECLRLSRE